MTCLTKQLGDCADGTTVRFRGGELGVVVRQDDDDFDRMTLVRLPQRRRRSMDDAKQYQFRASETVEVV